MLKELIEPIQQEIKRLKSIVKQMEARGPSEDTTRQIMLLTDEIMDLTQWLNSRQEEV